MGKTAEKSVEWDVLLSLPPEILFDILSRLPIKCLMKCKALNKDWYQLITSPGFVHLHLKHAKENKERILFASTNSGITSLHSSDYETVNKPMLNYNFRLPGDLVMVGTCNGLVCLSDYKTMIVICNPATRKHFLKLFEKFDVLDENYEEEFCLGFGHDTVSDEYKVMRVDFSYHKSAEGDLYTEKTQVFVYTLGTDSWREIQLPFLLDKGISVLPYASGALHVFERTSDCKLKDPQTICAIVSFDLENEEFRRMSMPNTGYGGILLGALEGCLSMSTEKRKRLGGRSDIWLMKEYGVMKSWSKAYSFSVMKIPDSTVPLASRKDKVILLQPWGCDSNTNIYSYDPKSTKVDVHSPAINNWNSVDSYVESLLPVPHFSERKDNRGGRKRRVYTFFS
ncbi:hypothetical protein ACHQM5_029378 [Ranunculus cassubicifolius]